MPDIPVSFRLARHLDQTVALANPVTREVLAMTGTLFPGQRS